MTNSIFTFTSPQEINFAGKNYVLTGFSAQEEKELTKSILSRGGLVRSSLVLATDYLVVNECFDHQSVKYKKAVELNAVGKKIEIISKKQFDELVKNAMIATVPTEEKPLSDIEKPIRIKKKFANCLLFPREAATLNLIRWLLRFLALQGGRKNF